MFVGGGSFRDAVSVPLRLACKFAVMLALAVTLSACGSASSSSVSQRSTTTTGASLSSQIARLPAIAIKTNTSVHAISIPVPYGSGSFVISSAGRTLALDYLAASSDAVVFSLKLPILLPKTGASVLATSGPVIVGAVGWVLIGDQLVKVSLSSGSGSVSSTTVSVVSTVKLSNISGISAFLVADASRLFVAGASNTSTGGGSSVVCESLSAVSGSVLSSTSVRGSQVLSLVAGGQAVWLTSETQGGVSSGPEVITNALNPLNNQITVSQIVSKSGEYALMTTTPNRTWGALFSGLAFAPSSFVVIPSALASARPKVIQGVLGEVNDAAASPSGSIVWTVGPNTLFGFDSSTLHRVHAYRLKGILGTSIAVGAQNIWITANHEVVVVPKPGLG